MILIVGAGLMAKEYVKVLEAQQLAFVVVGRGSKSAKKFKEETGVTVETGGLDHYLAKPDIAIDAAIVATGVEQLFFSSQQLIEKGVKRLLVEKPAGLTIDQIKLLNDYAASNQTEVYVAYNRRFYSAVAKAKSIIEEDGGVKSFNFELTEWGHVIAGLTKGEGVKENWFMANTTHVADLAFYLGGTPSQMSCFTSGTSDWHSRSSNFAGAGISSEGALFSYHGNWGAPGRWSVEILTDKHRLIFRPMEKLQIQKLGSVAQAFVEIDDQIDIDFKPGLFNQVKAFVAQDNRQLCSLAEHVVNTGHYVEMAGY